MYKLLIILASSTIIPLVSAATPTRDQVAASIKRSADWQLENPSGISIHDWIIAPLYDGLVRTALTLDEPKYLAEVVRLGQQATWGPGSRVYHADDHAVGHAWLDIHLMDKSRRERLDPIKERLDYVLEHPVTENLRMSARPQTQGVSTGDRWTWCDALYMAPPTLTRLYSVTGDKRYLDFLDEEFKYTYDELWDADEKLFYRDDRFIDQRTERGKKIFWSRGNGWVYGGLALMLEHLPQDHPTRGFYENLFREMTATVVATQQEDGLWRPSLLDPEQVPTGETSGSGFFTFGLAWGINSGLIDGNENREAALRGWTGLGTRIGKGGLVGYVQPVGAAPDKFNPDSTADYGTGAFLLAGCEIFKMLGGTPAPDPAKVLAAAEAMLEENPPTAYARLVPERKDDLAWENDKVAFRIYGPALRDSTEDSGIDVWCKRVPNLVIDKWYQLDLAGQQSYHQDHGEGYDGYKVGDTLGCGGVGLWVDGKIVTANVYQRAHISWSRPDVAAFEAAYRYALADGRQIWEHREVRLRAGENLFDVTSTFAEGRGRGRRWGRNERLGDLPVAVGLVTQSGDATFTFDPDAGIMMLWDQLDGESLGTGVVVSPATVLEMKRQPHTGKSEGYEHALAIIKTDGNGQIHYRAGFGWSKAGEITTPEAWRAVLNKAAAGRAEN
jgi:unsaturated rhamnogalacturonyl hydrolase